MRPPWFPVPVCLMAAAACADASPDTTVATVRDSSGIEIVENVPAAADAVCGLVDPPGVEIGSTAGDEAQQLYRVFDATRLSDGRIAVVNQGSDEIRVYDASGAFLHAFGRAGQGPGEFRRVRRIWRLRGDTLLVGDYRPWRFSTFTSEGEFLGSVEPAPLYVNSPAAVVVLDDGGSIIAQDCCFDPSPGFHLRYLHAVRHAASGELVDTIGSWPDGRWGEVGTEEVQLISYPLFEPGARLAGSGDRIVVGDGSEADLEVRDGTGRLVRRIRWREEDREVTSADVDAFRRSRLDRAESPSARRFAEAAVGEHVPVNDRFPAFSALTMSEDGEVWVKRYRRPRDSGSDQWLVFSADGRFRCHAQTPAGLEVYEIGPDYVLAGWRDELDVEHVLLFARSSL